MFMCIDQDTKHILKYQKDPTQSELNLLLLKIHKGLHIFKSHLEIEDSDWQDTISEIEKILMLPALILPLEILKGDLILSQHW